MNDVLLKSNLCCHNYYVCESGELIVNRQGTYRHGEANEAYYSYNP